MPQNNAIFYRICDSLFRYRWLFLLSVFGVFGVTVAIVALRPRTYAASAATQVLAQETAAVVGVASSNNSYVSPAEQNVSRLRDLLNDNTPGGFMDTALHDAQLTQPINVNPAARDKRYDLLRKRLSVDSESDTIFTVSLSWDNPGECERIVRALQQQYIEKVGRRAVQQATTTEEFIDTEITKYAARLDKAEQALSTYKQENLGALPDSQTAMLSQLSDLRTKLNELKITAEDGEMERQALENRLAQIPKMTIEEQTFGGDPSHTTSSSQGIQAQIGGLQTRRSILLTHYTPEHPAVQALDAEIAALKKALQAAPREGSAAARQASQTKMEENPEYQDLMEQVTQARIDQKTREAQVQLLQQQIADYEARVRKLPAEDRELTSKTRDYTVLKTEYENLLARREQARIKASLDKASTEATFFPIGQIYAEPMFGLKKALTLGAGSAIFGLILGFALVFLREWLDHSLRYGGDASRLLGVPLLAVIPETDEPTPFSVQGLTGEAPAQDSGNGLEVEDAGAMAPGARPSRETLIGRPFALDNALDAASDNRLAEQQPLPEDPNGVEFFTENTLPEFSHLYAAVEHQASNSTGGAWAGADGSYVLGVTSAVAGEGKTTVALNLAINAARSTSAKICFIDLSLSDDNLSQHLGVLSRKAGIIKILEATEGGTLPTFHLSEYDNFATMRARGAPMDAARLARSPRIAELIATCRQRFGLVIIDLPAVATDNVLPLVRHLDGIVMVACAAATPKEIINRALDDLGRPKILGTVLNRLYFTSPQWVQRRLLNA